MYNIKLILFPGPKPVNLTHIIFYNNKSGETFHIVTEDIALLHNSA